MKIYFEPLDKPFLLVEECANIIVIENQKFYYNICCDLVGQLDRNVGEVVFSDDNQVVDVSKNVEILTDFVSFDVNSKNLVTKLQKKLSAYADNNMIAEKNEILSRVSRFIYEVTDCFDFELDIDDIEVSGLLKAANVRFVSEYDELSLRIYNYCKNVSLIEGEKLFVFLNLRNYLGDDEFSLFCNTMINHKFRCLFLENTDRDKLENENKVIIDKDLCVV